MLRLVGVLVVCCVMFLTVPGCCKSGDADAQQKQEGSDVGVGDFLDYATGKTQIEIKKSSEERLKRIQDERNRQFEEALKETGGTGE